MATQNDARLASINRRSLVVDAYGHMRPLIPLEASRTIHTDHAVRLSIVIVAP